MLDLTKIPAVLRALPWEEPTTEDRFVFCERVLLAEVCPPDETATVSEALAVDSVYGGGFWLDQRASDVRCYGWGQDMLDAVLAFVRLDPPPSE